MTTTVVKTNATTVQYPPFPNSGSLLSSRYFTIGRLGRGTFCSIHKCIDLKTRSIVAAKVELADFANSGVLEGEASILRHLAEHCAGAVPDYMEYVKENENICAIIMEYLPGEDMHLLRDKASANQDRRLHVTDAVYLTADVMLPLLKKMHDVGVLHRDVKPSNCVRMSPTKEFKIVDFGLSKSFVVPETSSFADKNQPWNGIWSTSKNGDRGHIRQERPKAEFRGTSMYASLPVHQMKDYARRDDMWSLMYVFCDLVSGGLPWMGYAAARDRESCRKMKENVHNGKEEELIKGTLYHKALYCIEKIGDTSKELPKPLAMSGDLDKVQLLRKAFQHLSSLSFVDKPDYDLIGRCIRGFLPDTRGHSSSVKAIQWDKLATNITDKTETTKIDDNDVSYSSWMTDDHISKLTIKKAEEERLTILSTSTSSYETDLAKLHMSIQIRYAQVEYNVQHPHVIPKPTLLKDWIFLAYSLTRSDLCDTFNTDSHLSSKNAKLYRNESHAKMLQKCLDLANDLGDCFRSREYFYGKKKNKRKRLSTISMLFCDVRGKLAIELEKQLPPPPSIFMSS